MDTVTLTKEMIEAVMTGGIGLSPAKYTLLGGEGRMSAGWKDRLVGKVIPASHYDLLRRTVGMKRRDFKRLRDAEIARAASETTAPPVEKRWDEVAGIKGKLPKPRRTANAPRQTPARADVADGRLRNTNSYEEFTARQLPLLLIEPAE